MPKKGPGYKVSRVTTYLSTPVRNLALRASIETAVKEDPTPSLANVTSYEKIKNMGMLAVARFSLMFN